MSLQIGSLYEKHAEVETIDGKTGEVRKAKRIYYAGTIQIAAFPHLSGHVNIVPRAKPTTKSPDWTIKRHAHGQWFEIGTAFNGELEAGGRFLNLYLYAPPMDQRLNAKAWPNPSDPDHSDEEPAYRVVYDVKRQGAPAMSSGAPSANGAGAAVPFDH